VLSDFYFGTDAPGDEGLRESVTELGDIDARALSSFPVPGDPEITIRVGRYGTYIETTDGRRANVAEDLPPDELTAEYAHQLLDAPVTAERELGTTPDTNLPVVAKDGRYGPYVTEVLAEDAPKNAKARTGSLFKSMSIDTVTLEDAMRLLSLPRVVGEADGEPITAQNGRYGPYLKKGTDSRSLTTEDQIFDVTLEEALAIYAQPKLRGRAAAAAPLKELGNDPVTGTPMVVKSGRFGPYVTDGTTNATLRKDDEVDDLTPERAAELLADKRAKGPAPKKAPVRRAPTKKTTAKKTTTAKKVVAAKTATKPPALTARTVPARAKKS
jgi:DNA topoisomerase-1